MPSVRADELKIGQETSSKGQKVVAIRFNGVQYNVTWLPQSTRKKYEVGYFADQTFDMAPDGADREGTNMAQRVNIIVTSDLSDKEGAETVTFGLDGTTYEVDLTEPEQSKLRDALAKYVGAGRKVTGSKGSGKRSGAAPSGPPASEVRAWAQANGHNVPERGRIPAEVREAYTAAHA